MKYTINLIGAAILLGSSYAAAQTPQIKPVASGIVISALSDNGKYGVSSTTGELEEGGIFNSGGMLWDIDNMTSRSVTLPATGIAGAFDVTDDGQIVVGSCDNIPAYWSSETSQWTLLPLPQGTIGGQLLAVTPDGKRAVGFANITSDWDAVPVLYALDTNTLIELPNVPTVNMNHDHADYSAFCSISPDGRYILGRLSQEVLMPPSMCAYIYDTATDAVDYIGFNPSASGAWRPAVTDLLFIDDAVMSPDGQWVGGAAYMTHPQAGSEWNDEYYVGYRYNVKTHQTEIFDGPYDSDVKGNSITNSGLLLISSPADSPYASMLIRQGNYYYSLADIFSQAYATDFFAKTGYQNTGKPIAVSADGLTVAMLVGPSESYILQMPQPWADATSRVNLLSSYTVTPAIGSTFASVSQVKVAFTRNIDYAGAPSRIKLLDDKGNELRSATKAEVDKNTLTVSFRPISMETARQYTVNIPAGLVTMVDDISVTAGEINVTYTGRADHAVAPQQISPQPGSAFARIDASTSPVCIAFDASLALNTSATPCLRRKGETSPVADLYLSLYDDKTVAVYPLSRQYLFEGTEYEVVIPAGVITDLSGVSANEEIIIGYRGTYVREVSADDRMIFADDCSNYDGFLFYEGDHLTPASTPAGWGFTKDNPWRLVHSSDDTPKMAMAAHSMFADSGTADDWMSTPQLYIPDGLCYLSFEAQSYKLSKADRLKVYALVTDKVISTLTAADINAFRTQGELLFDQQLSPGASEEDLEDDWTTYTVKLPQYAGKSIYLAFVNDNTDQSAVFINRVEVVHDVKFLISITSDRSVVAADSASISGVLTVASDLLTVSSADFTLRDSRGAVIADTSLTGLSLTKGASLPFSFGTPLPLVRDEANRYQIDVDINSGEEKTSVRATVKNLAFRPTQRLFIEEYSGRSCSNCPLGFLAMDHLEALFPGQIIPAVIRTYDNDPLGAGLGEWTQYLGLNNIGAPSASINRSVACVPMVSVGLDYRFSGEGIDDDDPAVTWLDAAVSLLAEPADADLDLSAVYDGNTGLLTIDGNARWAINTPAMNVNVLTVLTEDAVETLQLNNLYSYQDPDLQPWGAGGIYGKQVVQLTIDNVARGCFGMTFNGSHILPSSAIAGQDNRFNVEVEMPQSVESPENTNAVVVLIDGDTDRVVNCAKVPVTVVNAISTPEDGNDSPTHYFDLQGRRIPAPVKGAITIVKQGQKVSKKIFK